MTISGALVGTATASGGRQAGLLDAFKYGWHRPADWNSARPAAINNA